MPEKAFKSQSTAGGGVPSGHTVSPRTVKPGAFQNALKKVYDGIGSNPSASDFVAWLKKTETADVTESDIPVTNGVVTFEDFGKFMLGHHGSAMTPVDWRKQDLTRPLNEYFISSSHNTYLTGHQLYGESTVDGYVDVLRRGCRCIEIDVWDGDDGEPEVFHGYTLTKEITFKEVIKAIGKEAFRPDEGIIGPVIISLECHAGYEQQKRCVEIMKDVLGDKLVVGPLDGSDLEDIKHVNKLPSPLELQGKVLVKSKYRPPEAKVDPEAIREPAKIMNDTTSSSSDSEMEELARKNNKKKPKKHKMIHELSRLGLYSSAHHFVSFDHETSKIPNHVFSFSERVFLNHLEPSAYPAFEHNLNHLCRIYPFGLRFSSTNTDPSYYWRLGAQILALNWQKIDDGMMLNEGMFSGYGGYVLKPKDYRPDTAPPKDQFPTPKMLDLKIKVLAVQDLPLPIGDTKPDGFEPYFKFMLHTDKVPSKEVKARVKGQTRAKRGVTCEFNEEVVFAKAPVLGDNGSLAFLRAKIKDKEFGKDSLGGWFCVRVDRLKPGYGVLRVIDAEGKESHGIVLVHVTKRLQ